MCIRDSLYTAKLSISTENRIGVLSDLAAVFTKAGINMQQVSAKNLDRKFTSFEIGLDVESTEELSIIMAKVSSKKFAVSCTRMINEKS